ncbi:MAG: DUF1704 domain-containing protein, partial [Bdellovibrionales bacterium]|nr:DUF1704 domain-containing protein [Bdellovibrionales bacterium]
MNRKSEAAIRHCDQLLLNAAKGIKILSHLNWSPSLRRRFLTNWKRGNPILPKVTYSKIDYKEREVALKKVVKLCPRSDPRGKFIYRTAKSYLVAIRMLNSLGKSTFCRLSTELYGCPTDRILGSRSTHLTAAKRFIVSTDPYDKTCRVDENEICILPQTVQAEMQTRCDQVFGRGVVEVKLDPKLASKAAAGARRIRIRSSTCFSHEDISQLIEHEAFVHSLTSLNGREQGGLKALSLSAPRTTGTQEGLALFAELITHSMDLHRLRRIALRVIGVQMGIEGADFIDSFKFFLAAGQNELGSYQSTARIFGACDFIGIVVYTK